MREELSDITMDDLGEKTKLYEAQSESDDAIEALLQTTSYNYAAEDEGKNTTERDHSASNYVSPSFVQPSGAIAESMFAALAEEYREIAPDYRVGDPIGRGGCAVVLEAWRKFDDMHVVIKVLQVSSGLDEKETKTAIARFMREAKLIASLHEEHIVKCVDYGCYQGTPCMVLEFIDGLSLDKLLENYGALPLAQSTSIIIQLLNALAETHSRKIIHRDIKPSNIMVFDTPPNFEIRVLDFGISSVLDGLQSQTLMTQQGNVRGTPSYMAPELFTGDTHASIESDLYAVGLVYLECLTGEIAVNDKSFMRVAYKQVNEELFIPGSIPPDIINIIRKLCEKKAENRYHSAQVVLEDIRAHIDKALEQEEKCKSEWEKNKATIKAKYKASKAATVTDPGRNVSGQFKYFVIAVLIILVVLASVYLYLTMLNKPAPEPSNPPPIPSQNIAAPQTEPLPTNTAQNDPNEVYQLRIDKPSNDIQSVINESIKEANEPPEQTSQTNKPKTNKMPKRKTGKQSDNSNKRLQDYNTDLPF